MLKNGEVDLAIAGPLGEEWDRLDAWPMFTESFDIVGAADAMDLTVEVFRSQRFLDFSGAEDGDSLQKAHRERVAEAGNQAYHSQRRDRPARSRASDYKSEAAGLQRDCSVTG